MSWHPQFSLKTLFWLTLVVAAFCAGAAVERELERRRMAQLEQLIRETISAGNELIDECGGTIDE